jgi:hypothetical protein
MSPLERQKGGEMEKARTLWIPVLSGVLLMAVMVAVVGAGGDDPTYGALGPTAYITVPGAAFNPSQDGADWYNYGQWIRNESTSDHRFYAGPIVFPHAGAVKITGIVLVAYDENPDAEACASLVRNSFKTGAETYMGSVCSTGSATGVRQFAATSISPDKVNPKQHGCYVSLMLRASSPPGNMVRAYAVRIAYRPVL